MTVSVVGVFADGRDEETEGEVVADDELLVSVGDGVDLVGGVGGRAVFC